MGRARRAGNGLIACSSRSAPPRNQRYSAIPKGNNPSESECILTDTREMTEEMQKALRYFLTSSTLPATLEIRTSLVYAGGLDTSGRATPSQQDDFGA